MARLRTEHDLQKGIERLVLTHPDLAEIAEVAHPYVLHIHEPGFSGLARIIIAQQVSLASAAAVHARFIRYIQPVSPAGFLDAGQQTWIAIGLTRPKQRALRAAATALIDGSLDLAKVSEMTLERAISTLTKIKGIGPWTAEVYLAMCAGRTDVFPANDLALREALRRAFNLDQRPDARCAAEMAAQWAPLRTFAANLFWSYYMVSRDGHAGQASANLPAASAKKG